MSYPPGPGQQPPQQPAPPQGYPQQPYPQQPYPQQVQPGMPPQQPHVVYVEKPSRKPAYEMGFNFLVALFGTLVVLVFRDEDPDLGAGVFGALLVPTDADAVETLGLALSIVLILASAVVAGLMFARLRAGMWVGIPVAAIGTGYYLYALIYLATNDLEDFIPFPVGGLVLWALILLNFFLPRLRRALRGQPPVYSNG